MPFQKETLTNWQANNFRGIIKHATGSGKTVTAIAAIDAHTAAGSPCIVVVPSALLLHQWKDEILKDIPDALVLLCGDGNDRWKEKQRLSNLLFSSDSSRGSIIIVYKF